ncbi:response regulator [Umezawaea sp. Da 62-37]|uniref:response regulator n=1 Tax=Umezawaea sp. Da 62-37 TaxID=3075927 RepID=UPI0028F709CE|nr:response regulator [Umezawaea sp. Da 62-37]WNV88184.1 response regulator [Umezawaea sp. Da 62-37]
MDTNIVLLIVALVVAIIVLLLLWRNQTRGGSSQVNVGFADLFTIGITLSATDAKQAKEAVRAADAERGNASTTADLPGLTESTTTLARVLWVDDLPDNNVYETVALEKLGKLVTKAASTSAALHYLERMDFTIMITDLGRSGDPNAGIDLIRRMRADGNHMPIVVYTGDAARVLESVTDAGADAVVDQPGPLIRVVQRLVSRDRRSAAVS